jgi:hypothetical protein
MNSTHSKFPRPGFHDSGPIGERDYEDAGSDGLDQPSAIQTNIAKQQAHLKATAASRWALRTKLVNEFSATNKRQPLRSELDRILDVVNRQIDGK